MKLFVFLLSFYILLLPLAPCGDSDDCKEETQVTAQHEHEESEDDSCAPFCCCACCPASIFTIPAGIDLSTHFVSGRLHGDQPASNYAFDFHSFWQPPKLS